MTQVGIAIVFFFLLLPQQSTTQTNGSLTVFPVPKEWSKYQTEGKICEPSKISLQIDNGAQTPWPQKDPLQVDGLALDRVHLVVARCGGKPLQAVKFRFSEFKSSHVCGTYDAYSGIELWDYTRHGWGCKK